VGVTYRLYNNDCLEWLDEQPENSFEAIVTDPPYGLKEYSEKEQLKLRRGNKGGMWRIPPALGGNVRSPLPRFTVLNQQDRENLYKFFSTWGVKALRVVVPGAHLFVATNTHLSHVLCTALTDVGWEKRGEIVRLVQTLKGGDRPKNAEEEFSDVTVIPRSAWEPWELFRKPVEGRIQDNLRKWKTGGLRRDSAERPFTDLVPSERTPQQERDIANHPSLKPQRFMRKIVYASLPLGEGRVLDPFMGGGSTIAAAESVGYDSVGVEIDKHYYQIAAGSIASLTTLYVEEEKTPGVIKSNFDSQERVLCYSQRQLFSDT
jgi:site-specific DNA-methyltransferase (adenine-specific)